MANDTPEPKLNEFTASLTEALRKLWAQSLKRDDVAPEESYFDAGGDSFAAVGLVAKIRRETGSDLTLRDLFDWPTPRGLAEILVLRQTAGEPRAEAGPAADFESDADPRGLPVLSHSGAVHRDLRRVLLTGATGLLGRHLLRDLLLTTEARIYCLLRAPSAEAGLARLELLLEEGGLDPVTWGGRFEVVPGDLGSINLGISRSKFSQLGKEIDSIYHCAADVSSIASYEQLRLINVLGTREALRFAVTERAKDFHHISSVAVFRENGVQVTESELPEPAEVLEDGYAQTKAVAEMLVRQARQHGVRFNVYRLGMIVGDSQTGATNNSDFTSSFVKGCVQARVWPSWRIRLHLVPADQVATAIIALSRNGATDQTFHLQNPVGVSLDELGSWIESYGFELERLKPHDWLARIGESGDENALAPFVPGLSAAIAEDAARLRSDDAYGLYSRISCDYTNGKMKELGCAWGPIDGALIHTYLDFYVNSGFLPNRTKVLSRS